MKKCALLAALIVALFFTACPDNADGSSSDGAITRISLIGDAALGWEDADGNPLPLFMTHTGGDIFEYKGTLTRGFLKISCDANPKWTGRWFLPYDDEILNNGLLQPMVYSTNGDGGEAGYRWEITKDASYTITLDKSSRTIQCEETGEAQAQGTDDHFNNMWLILAKENPLPQAMTRDGETWTITETFSNNDYIKFSGEDNPPEEWGTAAEPDPSTKWFCPPANGVWAAGTVIFKYGKDNTYAWRIPGGGEFTIVMNPKAGTIAFTGGSGETGDPSSTVWLVYTKPETQLGIFDSREMTNSAGVYTWEGALSGWYKFCARDEAPVSYGQGLWFGPDADNKTPEGIIENAYMDSSWAWFIPRGRYTITFSPTDAKATINKIANDPIAADYKELWVIGATAFKYESDQWNAPKNTARIMKDNGDGTFSWTYNFGEWDHFRVVCRNNGIIFYPNPNERTPGRGDIAMVANIDNNMLTRDQFEALTSSSPDNFSWWFGEGTNAGIRTITVNPVTQKLKFVPGGTPVDPGSGENIEASGGESIEIDTTTVSNIALVGTASPSGSFSYTASNVVKLYTQSANVYAWKGTLKGGSGADGQLKFDNGTQEYGPGAFTGVPGTGGTYPVTSGTGKPCWQISATGTYIVRLDLNANTVSFIIQ